jgi:hypothetical protein
MENAEHYLLTVVAGQDMHIHGYLAFRDGLGDAEQITKRAYEKIFAAADSKGVGYLPVVLITKLESGVSIVQECLYKLHPEARKRHEAAKDICLAVWFMLAGSEDDERLMVLH